MSNQTLQRAAVQAKLNRCSAARPNRRGGDERALQVTDDLHQSADQRRHAPNGGDDTVIASGWA
jgi:hypothetical protein